MKLTLLICTSYTKGKRRLCCGVILPAIPVDLGQDLHVHAILVVPRHHPKLLSLSSARGMKWMLLFKRCKRSIKIGSPHHKTWAHCIQMKTHSSYDEPPDTPFSGVVQNNPSLRLSTICRLHLLVDRSLLVNASICALSVWIKLRNGMSFLQRESFLKNNTKN